MGDICLFTIAIVEKKNSALMKPEKAEDKTDPKTSLKYSENCACQ